MIDTHCHLGEDYREVLKRAFEKKVHHVINICIHPEDIVRGLKIVSEFPTAPMAAGIHPCHAHEVEEGHFEKIIQLAKEKKINYKDGMTPNELNTMIRTWRGASEKEDPEYYKIVRSHYFSN